MDIGSNINLGVSQPSVSRSIEEVTSILCEDDIFNRWVHFPQNVEELRRIRSKLVENNKNKIITNKFQYFKKGFLNFLL